MSDKLRSISVRALVSIALVVALAGALAGSLVVLAQAPDAPDQFYDSHFHVTNYIGQTQSPTAWKTFEGTWSVTGQQTLLPTERGLASATQFSGAIALEATGPLTRAFRGQVITYDDGSGAVTGRAVWTDHKDDRIFSTLKGNMSDPNHRVTGTITGGTGAYAGITGDYSFEWQYVLSGDSPTIQGRAINLRGRYQGGTGQ